MRAAWWKWARCEKFSARRLIPTPGACCRPCPRCAPTAPARWPPLKAQCRALPPCRRAALSSRAAPIGWRSASAVCRRWWRSRPGTWRAAPCSIRRQLPATWRTGYNRRAPVRMRILLLSDIHSNLEALDACLAKAPAHDVAVNLGDIVGYGASPNEVIERSRDSAQLFVRGNHDKAACGLMDVTDFNPVAGMAALWTREHLKPENLEWLRQLPQGPIRVDEELDAQFVHGSPIDEDEYLVTLRDAQEPLTYSSVALTFFGHTHIQGGFCKNSEKGVLQPVYGSPDKRATYEVKLDPETQYLINPGSVGQPRDTDWRAAFAVFDTEAYSLTYYRVPYDLQRAQQRILDANLPQRLAQRLAVGR